MAQGKTVSDISDDPNNTTSNDSDPTVVQMGSDPSIAATKTVRVLENGDGFLGVGDAVEYTIIVENTGNAVLSDLDVQDNDFIDDNNTSLTLTTGPTFTISSEGSDEGTLIPGEKAYYIATFDLTQSVVDAGGLSNQATVYASSPGQTNDLDVKTDDPETTTIEDATALQIEHDPVIEVVKTATVDDVNTDGKTNTGDTITYTITVENKGNVTLTSITLEDVLTDADGNTSSLTPIFDTSNTAIEGTLQVGEKATYSFIYTITQTALDSGQVMNTVLATASSPKLTDDVSDRSDDGDDNDGDTDDDQTITPLDQSPSITVSKTAVVDQGTDSLTNLGDLITYTITIENTGDVTLTNILVTDVLTDGDGTTTVLSSTYDTSNTATEGTLAVGETATYTVVYTIDQKAVNSGSVSNNATVTAMSPAAVQVNDSLDNLVTTAIDQSASLEVTKVAEIVDNGDGVTGVGDIVQYTITVENTGSVTLTSIAVSDQLQDNAGNAIVLTSGNTLSFTGASQGSLNGTLQSGEMAKYTAYHVIDQAIVDAGGLTNSASANGIDPNGVDVTDVSDNGDDTDGNTTNDPTVTTIDPSPSMSVVKTAALVGNDDGIIEAGDLVVYTIVVTNTGNLTLFDVAITDQLTDQNGNTLTLTQDASIDGVVRDIAPGASESYMVTYFIDQDAADSGSIINIASASAIILDGSAIIPVVSDPAIITMTDRPSIEITKTSVENDGGDGAMDVGDTIDYTITVTNTGNVSLSNILVTDILTDGLGNSKDESANVLLSTINGSSTTIAPAAVVLSPDDVATYTLRYTIDQDDMNSGRLSNMASVSADCPDGTADCTDDQIDIAVENQLDQAPAMTLTKAATLNDGNDGSLDIGDTITYTLTLTNTGNVSLTNVSLSDTTTDLSGAALSLQSGPTYISGGTSFESTSTMAVGDVIVYEAVFTINQQAINAGGVSNTAEASATTLSQESLAVTSNTVDTPISAIARVEVNKIASVNDNGDGVNGLSDLIEYTITVENTGDIALENLTITDVITDNKGDALSLVSGPFFAGATANSPEGNLAVGEVASYKAVSYTHLRAHETS